MPSSQRPCALWTRVAGTLVGVRDGSARLREANSSKPVRKRNAYFPRPFSTTRHSVSPLALISQRSTVPSSRRTS